MFSVIIGFAACVPSGTAVDAQLTELLSGIAPLTRSARGGGWTPWVGGLLLAAAGEASLLRLLLLLPKMSGDMASKAKRLHCDGYIVKVTL